MRMGQDLANLRDYAEEERSRLALAEQEREEKRQALRAQLGENYILHPANRGKRGKVIDARTRFARRARKLGLDLV